MNETWWVDPTQLDNDQMEILTADAEESILIIGPPGCGKTNILMLRANYVRPLGPRQLLLTFTRSLAEHLRSGPNVGRADQVQREDIVTFMGMARSIIKNHSDYEFEDTGDFDKDRDLAVRLVNDVLNEKSLGHLYDVLFVDEVQDFRADELDIFRRLAPRMNLAGDSRQRIWKRHEGLKLASGMVDTEVELKRHYRIGEKICQYADRILPPRADQASLLEGCNYPERLRPSSVDTVECRDIDDAIRQCIENVEQQLRYITDEPIGIIGPKNEALDAIMAAIRGNVNLAGITVRQRSDDYQAYDEHSRVRVMTIHSAKGSEFRAVHILDAETFGNHNRELAFTAVTRAKTEVSVYHVGPLRGHMIPAKGELTPDISSIF